MYYLSTSKISIAVLGNFAFAAALCMYFLLTKVSPIVTEHTIAPDGVHAHSSGPTALAAWVVHARPVFANCQVRAPADNFAKQSA